ncbi:Transcriptional regulator, TetR family [Agrobacterium deltaense Zutra 3/1]|uniref:Transcriptional regulator, TetR family n=1 Tax=Agrobacterium deltaense Zutra 3/1 TaxID=1183427 RepID=A0A1S7S274_9HYPH|nr:TetR/AcrR family transcriptional regulator [Agrobacterium deltaense]CUX61227.1 Transcriptional regulator, TetR family [Agrobacterium deltaense Zutra 3/1]
MENSPADMPKRPAERSRGRPKIYSDEQRRQTILDEARRTFTEEGFRGTTIAKVAARCKISKQTIYESFESKIDLFKAVVGDHRRMMLDLPRPPDEDEPVDIVIERIFRIDIDEEMDRERDSFLTIIFAESKEVPELSGFIRKEGADASRRDLVDWLKVEIERGRLKIDNPASAARMLMDMLLGPTGPGRLDWATLEDRRRHLRWCIDFFLISTECSRRVL